MKRLVLKFGGTSVGTVEKIKKVANIIKKRFNEGDEIIVVVSAMSGTTDDLKSKSDLIRKCPTLKESTTKVLEATDFLQKSGSNLSVRRGSYSKAIQEDNKVVPAASSCDCPMIS